MQILNVRDVNGNWAAVPAIKGPKGDTGDTGATGPAGPQGETGATGAAGQDGFSPIITVDDSSNEQYVITIQDATHTETVTIKKEGAQGPKGDKGDKGDTGEPGPQGPAGTNGINGTTPIKGIDYWTDADQNAILSAVLTALPAAESVSV